ncbi:MAG TPA: NifB/NifX family molybdenum-iron cluster-binding protein [Fibrobacteria bacterium]|nr:NifB/NifX family molybdenum-iron cluster-binding protein [Fibrobacteria bacterium]HOX50132.1 NifB/NifX family molybdenum-iron cluster-binding protein [Fibrobacteria bacterium]
MKLAFPVVGTDLSSPLDGRFGRAPRFLIVETDSNAFTVLENARNTDASQGAGIQSAQVVIGSGAAALVTSHCGPKAFKVFQSAKFPVLQSPIAPVSELIEQFKAGSLKEMTAPDNAGHAG